MKPNPVVHFEMGYNDKERMCKFYESAFGWQLQKMGPDMGEYVVAVTTESDGTTGRPKTPGAINGGFYKKTNDPSSHAPSVVVAVDDINTAVEAIKAAGGKIMGAMGPDGGIQMAPMEIPGVGLWISAMDTEGNRFSVLQPKGM